MATFSIFRQVLRQNVTAQRMTVVRLGSGKATTSAGDKDAAEPEKTLSKDTLKQLVNSNKVVVFMKGNPAAPRCGFSNAVVQIMRMHGVQYDAHDVLQNEELRQGIKEFSEWPTIPQVFINGEFVGGCDILLQMHQSGDLIEQLKTAGIESALLKEANEASEGAKKDDK